jgi:hypothetical protein
MSIENLPEVKRMLYHLKRCWSWENDYEPDSKAVAVIEALAEEVAELKRASQSEKKG